MFALIGQRPDQKKRSENKQCLTSKTVSVNIPFNLQDEWKLGLTFPKNRNSVFLFLLLRGK